MIKFLLLFLLIALGVQDRPVLGPNGRDIPVSMFIFADGKPVDRALIKLYDKDRNFLCDKLSDTLLLGYNFLQDSAKIEEYGTYYVKVSKGGYRTAEVKIVVKDTTVQDIPKIELVPGNDVGFGWISGVVAIGILGVSFLGYRKYKMRRF